MRCHILSQDAVLQNMYLLWVLALVAVRSQVSSAFGRHKDGQASVTRLTCCDHSCRAGDAEKVRSRPPHLLTRVLAKFITNPFSILNIDKYIQFIASLPICDSCSSSCGRQTGDLSAVWIPTSFAGCGSRGARSREHFNASFLRVIGRVSLQRGADHEGAFV